MLSKNHYYPALTGVRALPYHFPQAVDKRGLGDGTGERRVRNPIRVEGGGYRKLSREPAGAWPSGRATGRRPANAGGRARGGPLYQHHRGGYPQGVREVVHLGWTV